MKNPTNISDIYPDLKIVPIEKCLTHEGIVQKWADRIAASILDHGVVKNPVIAAKHKDKYVVIDGMHRLAAFKQLELQDLLICEIDYFSDKIVLEGWDAFTFKTLNTKEFLEELFSKKDGYIIEKCSNLILAREKLRKRQCLMIAGDKGSGFYTVNKPIQDQEQMLDELIRDVTKVDAEIDARNLRVLYVANSRSDQQFSDSDAQSMIVRPQFTKDEIIEATLKKKLFPRKSTRHLIPDRPLRVDVDLSLFRANVDLETKNRLLDEHLKWCFESGRVRFYPESVYIFAD